jgi:hypothetical protein
VSPNALVAQVTDKIHYGYVRLARIDELAYDWTRVRLRRVSGGRSSGRGNVVAANGGHRSAGV